MPASGPLLLLILDGWGVREPAADNAIAQATTPNWDALWHSCPHTLLETSGEAVGLPAGQMGNSEVGHMNIGAGRVVYQELTRIDRAITNGEFARNPALLETIDAAGAGTVHVMGLLSAGGVHSHEDHFLAAIELAATRHAGAVAVHVFLDGRDTAPRSARASIEKLQARIRQHPNTRIASISGRFWAMDRDQHWERIHRAWLALAHARAQFSAEDALAALEAGYARGENDEFIQPTLIGRGAAMGAAINDGDSAIFINFRADRARQLSRVLVDPKFDRYPERRPRLVRMVTMTRYEADLDVAVAFPPSNLQDLLGQVLARAGLRQLRIAETEKYAHVTYFFNGGHEQPFDGEDRKLIASPRVATYDLQPEMSAPELAQELVAAIRSGTWPVIVCNVANPDMVGHSGIFDAAVRAVEAVDVLLGQVIEAIDQCHGQMIVTADHGNVEQMSDPDTGQVHTAHTLNPVPLVYRGQKARIEQRGSLRDIAPTMLHLLGLPIPTAMTGHPLIYPDAAAGIRSAAADGTRR